MSSHNIAQSVLVCKNYLSNLDKSLTCFLKIHILIILDKEDIIIKQPIKHIITFANGAGLIKRAIPQNVVISDNTNGITHLSNLISLSIKAIRILDKPFIIIHIPSNTGIIVSKAPGLYKNTNPITIISNPVSVKPSDLKLLLNNKTNPAIKNIPDRIYDKVTIVVSGFKNRNKPIKSFF